ncbi:MAG: hypothetical protein AAF518_04425 [Spirochaetota bacterium]
MDKWIRFEKGKSKGLYNLSQVVSIRKTEETEDLARFTLKTTRGVAFSVSIADEIADSALTQIEEFLQEEITNLCEVSLESVF